MNLKDITISRCGTFHVFNGAPLYSHRFRSVMKFHNPGLAPVSDATGAFHIDLQGNPIYPERYRSTFGFYDALAAVEDQMGRCWHIQPDGRRAYQGFYAWCGNFQEEKCVVRDAQGLFFHIHPDGTPVYPTRYAYVGDYRDGFAVVKRPDGKSTHIDLQGALLHDFWYEELDLFHKGYARCRDAHGWFHISEKGLPAYAQRYQDVEPFYNGLAYATTLDNHKVLIDSTGAVHHTVYQNAASIVARVSGHLTQYWESFALMHFLDLDILARLPATSAHLARILYMPQENIERLLALIADMGYVVIAEGVVSLSPAGQALKEIPFLKDAATLWSRLAQEWMAGAQGLKNITQGFPHFKSKESCSQATQIYQRALEGYAKQEVPPPAALAALHHSSHQNVLFVGRQGLPWACAFAELYTDLAITASFTKWTQEPTHADHYPFSVRYLTQDQRWPAGQFDAIYIVKSFMERTESAASALLQEAVRHLAPEGDLWILEPVIGTNGSVSGLNLNMLYECGGKVRTQPQWQALLKAADLSIVQMYPLGANTFLQTHYTPGRFQDRYE